MIDTTDLTVEQQWAVRGWTLAVTERWTNSQAPVKWAEAVSAEFAHLDPPEWLRQAVLHAPPLSALNHLLPA